MHIYLPCDIFFFKTSTFKLPKGNFILEIQGREKSHRIFSDLTEIWNQTHRLAIWGQLERFMRRKVVVWLALFVSTSMWLFQDSLLSMVIPRGTRTKRTTDKTDHVQDKTDHVSGQNGPHFRTKQTTFRTKRTTFHDQRDRFQDQTDPVQDQTDEVSGQNGPS